MGLLHSFHTRPSQASRFKVNCSSAFSLVGNANGKCMQHDQSFCLAMYHILTFHYEVCCNYGNPNRANFLMIGFSIKLKCSVCVCVCVCVCACACACACYKF